MRRLFKKNKLHSATSARYGTPSHSQYFIDDELEIV
jgi:hypothetical protein